MSERPSRFQSTLIRVLDFVGLAALLLSLTIFVTGGFREWMPWGRVSLTTPLRPLLIGVLALVARHWLQPRPSVVARLAAFFSRVRRSPGIRDALAIGLTTRGAVLLAGILAVALIGFRADAGPPWRVHDNEFLNLPARWDVGWYLGIAAEGYRWQSARITIQQNIAFFPALPMAMRYLSLFLGRELLWTGVLISWVCFLWALVYVHRFTRERFDDDRARAAITLLACYPFALFYSTAYTEALFLLCLVGACYHFERDQLVKAGAWGLIAGLSRPNGCLLSVVLAFVTARRLWPVSLSALSAQWRPVATRTMVAAMPGVGMLTYSAFIYSLTGNPLQWTTQNAAWGRVYRGFDSLVADNAGVINQAIDTFAAEATLDVLHLAAVVFMFAAVWPVFRRLGLAYAVMILVNIVPPLMMGGLMSMGRVTSVLFPAFVWLATAVPASHRTAWYIGFAMVQAICAAAFFTWRPLF